MIQIGIVGLGGMGTVHHSNYQYIKGCKVVAAVGQGEQDLARARHWGVPLYSTVDEMCGAQALDVVDICTPTFLHKQLALPALYLGKHVICEKPAALRRADAEEMFCAARQNGVQLYVAQVLQFTREVEILREVIDDGRFGRPLDAYFERLSMVPRWAQGGWMFDVDKSGLLPFDLHIHDLDIIVSLFGRPKSYAYTSCGNPGRNYKEQYRFTYAYDDLHVSAEAAWFNADIPFAARWRVYFENALLVNDGEKLVAYPAGGDPILFDTTEKHKVPTGINLPPTGMFLNELSHFIGCVQQNRPSPLVTEKQVLTVVALLEEIVGEANRQ